MSVPPAPPPIEDLGHRRFSFYPAIANCQHNEWIYRRATWSEVLVQNTRTNEEIWVPRCYFGAISRVDEPVVIVGLLKELEYKQGALWAVERRVIEMQRAVNDSPRARWREPAPQKPASVISIRLENRPVSRVGRVMLGGVSLGIIGCVLAISLYRGGIIGSRAYFTPVAPNYLSFGSGDDYGAIVRALGRPSSDHWFQDDEGMQYRALFYARQGFHLVLMGRDRDGARYIGALDRNWNPIHSVRLAGAGSSLPLLRTLKKF
jgi:hypothetical protein